MSITRKHLIKSVWDDINYEADAMVLSKINYNPVLLSDNLYDRSETRKSKKQIKYNRAVIQHKNKISSIPIIQSLVENIIKPEHVQNITTVDKIFLNAFYRKLLRAKLEITYIGKELVPGLIITDYNNPEIDIVISKTLSVMRIICNFLGIPSTIHNCTFPIEKLHDKYLSFWSSVSNHFITLFGERTLEPIIDTEPDPFTPTIKHYNNISQILKFLNVVFNKWSNSKLLRDCDVVEIVPAKYITRMLPLIIDL